ncbi:MAG: G5 domain-containing protein [Clostridia bacterium]|nr:G5 domain-containing protein [Clostridia bacterium]
MRIRKDQHTGGRTPWRNRLAALAMLSVVSAACITYLVAHMQSFTVVDGDNRFVISTLTDDPAEALQQAGVTVGEHDAIQRPGGYNELVIDRSFVVNVTVNGVTTPVHMTSGTVGDALKQLGVDMDEYRLVNAQYTDAASAGQDICLESAVTYSEYTKTEKIPYEKRVEYTSELPKGRSVTVQKGKAGSVTRTYRDTIVDGEVVATVILTEVRVAPVEEIRRVGTQVGAPMSPAPYEIQLDAAGQPVGYEKVITGKCTAYTNDRGLCGNTTSTGRPAAVGVVAVDPNVIPYGTELYIVSADGRYVYGYAIAGDTGGACRAGRIVCDLFMDTYEECILFGRRDMNVYILN